MGVVANVNSPRRMTIHTTRAVSSSAPPPPPSSSSSSSDDTTAPPPSPTARSYHLDQHHHNPPPPHNDHHQFFHSLNEDTPFQLCFLRHGQSTWNRDNRFIGWTDTPLTDDGVLEARIAGQMMRKSGIRFDEVHTSLLRRSIRTTNLVLMELHQEYIPVYKHWRLNERSYGDLVGQHKKEAVLKFGKDQVKRWRRSYDEPPPPMQPNHPYHPANDPRYGHVSDVMDDFSAGRSDRWKIMRFRSPFLSHTHHFLTPTIYVSFLILADVRRHSIDRILTRHCRTFECILGRSIGTGLATRENFVSGRT